MIDPSSLIGSAALLAVLTGAVVAFWSKLKALAWRVASLVVVRVVVDDSHHGMVAAVAGHLWRHGRRSRFGERAYNGVKEFVRPRDRRLLVAYEDLGGDAAVFWIARRPVVVTFGPHVTGQHHHGSRLTLTFVRGTFDPDALVRAAVAAWNEARHGAAGSARRFAVRRLVGRGPPGRGPESAGYGQDPAASPAAIGGEPDDDWRHSRRYLDWAAAELGQPDPPDPLGPLAFPAAIEAVVAEIRRWHRSEAWYKERRIPWRFGLGLYGKPGTGKSSLARALAAELDLVLFTVHLASMSDRDLCEAFDQARAAAPCLVLIEDVDTVFDGRANVLGEGDPGLTFGCLLNCIQGVENSDGLLVVVTTNRPEALDPALGAAAEDGRSTRPGRLDRVVELGPLDEECRRRVAARILNDCPQLTGAAVAAGAGETGAAFADRCCKTALEWYWSKPATE